MVLGGVGEAAAGWSPSSSRPRPRRRQRRHRFPRPCPGDWRCSADRTGPTPPPGPRRAG